MNIELRFLQKAIEDKNYISFSYKYTKYIKVKPISLKLIDNKYILNTGSEEFEFNKILKLKILKDRF